MKKTLLAAVLSAALPFASAHAEVTFNGFANVVGGKTSSDDTQWGYDDDISFKQDSLFALQASTNLSEGLTATVQMISRGENDWDTEFEWAYLAYDISDQTRVLAGRQRAPMYMFSDYLDVSYAYPWITPPEGVYDLELTKFDGISLIHSFELGEFDSSIQVFAGTEENEVEILGQSVNSNFDKITGGSITLNRDWLTLRTAYLRTDLSIPSALVDQVIAAWNSVPGFGFIGQEATIVEDDTKFVEYAAQIDYENWLLIAEYTKASYDSMPLETEESMFVTAGYRMNDVLVHLTYGQDENKVNATQNLLPFGINAELDQLSGITQQLFRFREQDSSYYTLGARWDFHSSASFKFEFSRLDNDLTEQDSSLVRTALVTIF